MKKTIIVAWTRLKWRLINGFTQILFSFSFSLVDVFEESESGCNGSRLRQNRNVRTNWEGHFGVQCVWYRVKALVRYVGIPEKTYCSMAHSERSRRGDRRRQKVNLNSNKCSNVIAFISLLSTRLICFQDKLTSGDRDVLNSSRL